MTTDSTADETEPLDPVTLIARAVAGTSRSLKFASLVEDASARLQAFVNDRVDDYDGVYCAFDLPVYAVAHPTAECAICGQPATDHRSPTVVLACADSAVLRHPALALSVPVAVRAYLDELSALVVRLRPSGNGDC